MPKYTGFSKACFQLGSIFDVRNPWAVKVDNGLLQVTTNNIVSTSGSQIDYDFLVVTTHSELLKKMNVNVNFQNKWALANADASASYEKTLKMDDTSFALVLNARKTFFAEHLANKIELSEKGAKYLAQAISKNKIEQFVSLTGTEIVTSVTREYMISVVYHFKTSSREQKEKVVAKVQANWNSGSAKIDFASELKEIDTSATLHITAHENGASTNHESIADLIKIDPNDLSKVKSILSDALKKATKENAPIVEASTVYLHQQISELIFADNKIEPAYENAVSFDLTINNSFDTLYQKYVALTEEIEKTSSLVNGKLLESHFKPSTKEKIIALDKDNKTKLNSVRECYNELSQTKSKDKDSNEAILKSLKEKIQSFEAKEKVKYTDFIYEPFILFTKWNNPSTTYYRDGTTENFSFDHKFYLTLAVTNAYFLISRIEIFDRTVFKQALGPEDLKKIRSNGGSTEGVYELKRHLNPIYQWGWECHYCEETRGRVKADHEKEVKEMNIKMVIYTTDGNQHVLELGNPMNPANKSTLDIVKSSIEMIKTPYITKEFLPLYDGSSMRLIETRGFFASVKSLDKSKEKSGPDSDNSLEIDSTTSSLELTGSDGKVISFPAKSTP